MVEPANDLTARLARLHPKLIDLSLGRMERLLARLDHPQRALPPTIHVAGTNGKGSTIAFLRAMNEAAGRRVHVYTSPHLVRFNERIRLAGRIIADEELGALLDECEMANGEAPITFFEITTILAFLAFSRVPADLLLLETGLGGKYDATNVIERPAATLLCPISRDHENFLGSEIAGIAAEKAAIMKRGALSISAIQPPEAASVVVHQAELSGVELRLEGRDFTAREESGGMVFESAAGQMRLPAPALLGTHQVQNAGLALAVLDALPALKVGPDAMAAGLGAVSWPGRLQVLTRGPLTAGLGGGWELWLDGGHNGAAGAVLARQAETWADKPLYVIFGMLESKDPAAFLAPLAPHLAALRGVAIAGQEASLSSQAVAQTARQLGIEAGAAETVSAAIGDLVAASDRPSRILICGSLYLAGMVLAENG